MFQICPETFIFITVENVTYARAAKGTLCSDEKDEITSESKCKEVGIFLDIPYSQALNGTAYYPGCFEYSGRLFFNRSPNPKRTNIRDVYSAICRVDVGKKNRL